jgi:hypothetical protein
MKEIEQKQGCNQEKQVCENTTNASNYTKYFYIIGFIVLSIVGYFIYQNYFKITAISLPSVNTKHVSFAMDV